MRTGNMRIAEVSTEAIKHNVKTVKALTHGNLIAVVKANGYGHGALIAAEAALAGGATQIGVSDLEEAIKLREGGIAAPILCWLHGSGIDFREALKHRIEIGVSHLEQLESVAVAQRQLVDDGGEVGSAPATVQLKLDTGLSRNGAAPAEWEQLFARAAELERQGILRVRGMFTHLANAGRDEDFAQAAEFDRAVYLAQQHGLDPELLHVAASAATLTRPELHYNTVRVGVLCYGLSPFADKTSAQLGLRPAMRLKSEIVALRQVSAGTGVSYGFNWRAQSDTILGLVPVGYADGMPRALNNSGATVLIRGRRRQIVGRIGMDQCIIDLGGDTTDVQIGDEVVLFGDPARGEPPVEDWADRLGTINYEVVASLGERPVRIATTAW